MISVNYFLMFRYFLLFNQNFALEVRQFTQSTKIFNSKFDNVVI